VASIERGFGWQFAWSAALWIETVISFPFVMLCVFHISMLDIWGINIHNENECF
jgi:hypothetical protein